MDKESLMIGLRVNSDIKAREIERERKRQEEEQERLRAQRERRRALQERLGVCETNIEGVAVQFRYFFKATEKTGDKESDNESDNESVQQDPSRRTVVLYRGEEPGIGNGEARATINAMRQKMIYSDFNEADTFRVTVSFFPDDESISSYEIEEEIFETQEVFGARDAYNVRRDARFAGEHLTAEMVDTVEARIPAMVDTARDTLALLIRAAGDPELNPDPDNALQVNLAYATQTGLAAPSK